MANINKDLFRRFSPKNKLEMINKFTKSELLSVSESTILRMLKEAGSRMYKTVRKELYISSVGNNWNSSVKSIYENKNHEVVINLYIQGDDTDSYDEITFKDSKRYDYWGEFEESYLGGQKQIIQARYDDDDKARVYKAILEEYVLTKYADKLKN